MLNLIRMNGYRITHMTCMYVLAAIIGVFAIFSVSTISMTAEDIESGEYPEYDSMAEAIEAGWNDAKAEAEGETEENSAAYEAGKEAGEEWVINLGIISEQPIRADGTVTSYLAYLYEDITSGVLLIFITIAAVLFFNREQNSGFIKNIAAKSTSRVNIYFSKFIIIMFYILFAFGLLALAEYIALMIYYHGELTFGMDIMGDFLAKMVIVFLLHVAFVSGVVMLTTVTKSSSMGITIGMLALTGFTTFIILPIKAWLDIDISEFMIAFNINKINLNSSGDLVTDTILVGIITIIVYNVIGCTYFAKKDIA